MKINIKQRMQFDVSGKEFSMILRALKRHKSLDLYESLLGQRIQIAETFLKDAVNARDMFIQLSEEK